MKYLFTCLFLFITIGLCHAQRYTIKGTVLDTLNNNPLPNASVTLIRASDSVMQSFARARENGTFELHTDSSSQYLVLISFPGFADFVDIVKPEKNITDIGIIPMLTRTQLLKEVVISKERAAIKIKGDTIEYVADSFKTRDNATVEELLKKLPGLEVDRNGQIMAQGEKVQKILIDGEEFFADDPAMVTKSLQAKIVDKVQVFDKKSDQAEFTGVDDGQKIKTVNLQLKENAHKGYLGKLELGGGTDQYFQNTGMVSAFRNKSQFAAFGIVSNTNQVGLGWEDKDKFNLNDENTTINDEGQTITYYNSQDDNGFNSWDGSYQGQGLPNIWTGGVHYSDKWNKDAEHAQGDYRVARQNVAMVGNTLTQYVLPDSQYYTKEHQDQFSTTDKHALSGMFEWKTDSLTSIKLSVNGGYRNSEISSAYTDESLTPGGDHINGSTRNTSMARTDQFINTGLLFKRKFAKKGRTFSAEFKENYKTGDGNGALHSNNDYTLPADTLHATSRDSLYTIDQKKQIKTDELAFSGKITYTEPLSEKAFLTVNYALSVHNNSSLNYSYDKPAGNTQYDSLDQLYSSKYVFNVLNNSGGAFVRFKFDKINLTIGSDIASTKYKQVDELHGDTAYYRNYFNLFPRAVFTYAITKQKYLQFTYTGRTQQPTIDQIQPLRQNNDPLNIAIGNPNLKQQFNNTFDFYYSNYKILERTHLWVNGGVTFVQDAISQSINSSVYGRTYQYVNTDGNYNGWLYVGYGFAIKKTGLRVGFDLNPNVNHSTQFVNGIKNVSDNNNYTGNLSFNYDKDNKFSISFRPGIGYSDNRATISTYATSYWTSDNNLNGSVTLPLKFEIGTDIEWMLRQRTVVFDRNNNVFRWNAYVSKKFLKSSQLELRMYVYDILNQNIGYNRFGQVNYIAENTYNTISRYGMMSLIWNFSRTGGKGVASTTK